MSSNGRRRLRVAWFLAVLAAWSTTTAHDFVVTEVAVEIDTDGTYRARLIVDVDALALGVSPEIDSALLAETLQAMDDSELERTVSGAVRLFQRRVRIRVDERKQVPEVSFPERGATLSASDEPSVLGTVAELSGRLPADARELTFGASRAFGPVVVTLTRLDGGGQLSHVLEPGEDSPGFSLVGAVVRPSRFSVARRYLVLGFEHILPLGLDHILFVLGLFLLRAEWRPLLWQVSAFTLAHTITLALSMQGIVDLPARWVETLIAASIVYVAVENLLTRELHPWRPVLVFLFGLLHGLGFAGVLRDLGLPQGEFVTSLVAFNVGVELGQLAVLLLAFLLVGRLRERAWYRSRVVFPASLAIAAVGSIWVVQRAW